MTVSLLAIAAGSLYSSFQTGLLGYRKTRELQYLQSAGSIAWERFCADLRNALAYRGGEAGFDASPERMVFWTRLPVYEKDRFPRVLGCVEYVFEEGCLKRIPHRERSALAARSSPQKQSQEFGVDVEDLHFSYGRMEEAGRLVWENQWDPRAGLPAAVALRAKIKEGRTSHLMERTVFLPAAVIQGAP